MKTPINKRTEETKNITLMGIAGLILLIVIYAII